jgi:hypothetical protein
MSPYPLIYCPRVDGKDVAKPACCAHVVAFRAKAGCGPDGSGGLIYGDALPDPVVYPWIKTPAGWWIYHADLLPQHLQRIDRHPRIQRWAWIDGVIDGHRWLIPQLLMRDGNGDLLLTIDRQLTAQGWQVGDDLRPLIESLMAIEAGVPLRVDQDERNAVILDLVMQILGLGSWVDRDLLIALGWFTEDLAIRVLRVAMGLAPALAEDPPTSDGLGPA